MAMVEGRVLRVRLMNWVRLKRNLEDVMGALTGLLAYRGAQVFSVAVMDLNLRNHQFSGLSHMV